MTREAGMSARHDDDDDDDDDHVTLNGPCVM